MNANLLQMLMQRFVGPRGGAMSRPMPAQVPFWAMSAMRQSMAPRQPMMPQQQQQQAMPAQQPAAPAATVAAPSIFDLVRAPQQQAQFDVRAAQGTKPSRYVPTSVTMSNVPAPAVFNMTGAPLPAEVFDVQAARGTKPSRYTPTSITMNAPTPAGPDAMRQMLAMMGGGHTVTPFAPFGQGQG